MLMKSVCGYVPCPSTSTDLDAFLGLTSLHAELPVDALVSIFGLVSQAGQVLNGRTGVVKSVAASGRYGVKVADVGIKLIKRTNLHPKFLHTPSDDVLERLPTSSADLEARDERAPSMAVDAHVDSGELQAQTAIQESLHDAKQAAESGPPAVHGQLSRALLGCSLSETTSHVVLIKFSRRCAALREALLAAPGLAECQAALQQHDRVTVLPSGASIFVKPAMYDAVVEHIRLVNYTLFQEYVIADPELEDVVFSVVSKLPKRNKVYHRVSGTFPLAFAAALCRCREGDPCQPIVQIERTFLSIRLPSSLRSLPTDGPVTVSTTDADICMRKGGNPRKK